ncbi:uncharacterized protein CDV56_108624 [Aspergillus thermomutatus]|uniref:Uncharacterized protein n=1 Tax=Aspergillus thermomutatus TaxID=41047 RepID=A0A397HUX3_ASPTH|nr:uncharacterized protein CDV56_108624 [Aspergillus thermomutatus]RHZ64943.1 hypothetical protein CDV56_108624 [Aspergillus thermomutatus]
MNIITLMQNRPRLTGVVSLAVAGSIVAYLGKRRLDRSCPRVPITQLPKSSACRNLVESGEAGPKTVWGMEKSALLASWSGGDKTRWVPSFAALQADVPISLLAGYGAFHSEHDGDKDDAHHLMQNLVAAFLDARAAGPEAWFLDKEVPPLSFAPGSLLFGDQASLGAFMLGTWSTTRETSVHPQALGPKAPEPSSEFPSNRDAIQDSPTDTAGAVIYWKFPDVLVRTVDKAASYGLPWRFMDGGFQEFIVEKVSDEKARVTYISVECSNLHPRGQSTRDFKMFPWLAYEAHVLYAQLLWHNTVMQLHKPHKNIG